jgi:ankyrin repeat protein
MSRFMPANIDCRNIPAPHRRGFGATAGLLLWAVGAVGAAAAESPLANAIQNGERDAALAMLADGADVNLAQGDGTTPLHWAVYQVDVELTRRLLDAGSVPDAFNLYGSSPLAEAVKIANPELVELLLAAGSDVESPNLDGQTALMLAARTGSMAVSEQLIAAGADINARESWRAQTVLMWAADARFPALVQTLVERGAELEPQAMANDWPSQITSEPRAQYRPTGGLTALLYAARAGCTDCVSAILDGGADIDRPNPDGVTALMIAIDNFAFDTAELLLNRGANPHLWDWWGRTALYIAADMSSYNSRRASERASEPNNLTAIDIIDRLLTADVNPNPQLNMHRPSRGGNMGRFVDDLLTTGATPLLRAAIGHDVEALRTLLQHGAAVDLPNVMGVTALMAAAGMGVSQRDRRLTLDGDVESRAIETLDLLLAAGADINARVTDIHSRSARIARISTMTEREGQTALFGAIKFDWPRVVQYLIDNGADTRILDAQGKTPLDAATGQIGGRDNIESEEIAALLRAVSE